MPRLQLTLDCFCDQSKSTTVFPAASRPEPHKFDIPEPETQVAATEKCTQASSGSCLYPRPSHKLAAAHRDCRNYLLPHPCSRPIMGQLAQSIVREFCALVAPPQQAALAPPWSLSGPDQQRQWTVSLQLRALPPLCTGGTFSSKHRQQVSLQSCLLHTPGTRQQTQGTVSLTSWGCGVCCWGVLQGAAVAHVCERVLQHLVDSGILTLGWRHWPPTWMQEGGACAECLGSCALMHAPHTSDSWLHLALAYPFTLATADT